MLIAWWKGGELGRWAVNCYFRLLTYYNYCYSSTPGSLSIVPWVGRNIIEGSIMMGTPLIAPT